MVSELPVVEDQLRDQLRQVTTGLSSRVGIVALLSENIAADPRGRRVPTLAHQLLDASVQLIDTTRRLQDLLESGEPDRPDLLMPPLPVALTMEASIGDPAPRAELNGPGVMWAGDLCIELDSRVVVSSAERVALSPSEFTVLSILAATPDRVVPHHRLTRALRGADGHSWNVSSLYHLVARLRSRIDLDGRRGVSHIQNVRGTGYRFIGYPDERPRRSRRS